MIGIWSKIVDSSIMLDKSEIIPLNALEKRLGNGTTILFWKEVWVGNQSLMVRFPRLFRLELDPLCFVGDQWSADG